jgi:hypothetical protein
MIYNTFDAILEGYDNTPDTARDYARGMVWCEAETRESSIKYGRYVDTVDGIEIYYDYGADYYFFCPEEV